MSLIDQHHPRVVAIFIEPGPDGTSIRPQVTIEVDGADTAELELAKSAIQQHLRLKVFVGNVEAQLGGGGGTGHIGGYADGFIAGVTVSNLDATSAIVGRIEVWIDNELLAAFDFARLVIPAGAFPSVQWNGFGLYVLTEEDCGPLLPHVTVVSMATTPQLAPQGYSFLGRTFFVDTPDNLEYRPMIVQLPFADGLTSAQRRSLLACWLSDNQALLGGVACKDASGAAHFSILARNLAKKSLALVVR